MLFLRSVVLKQCDPTSDGGCPSMDSVTAGDEARSLASVSDAFGSAESPGRMDAMTDDRLSFG